MFQKTGAVLSDSWAHYDEDSYHQIVKCALDILTTDAPHTQQISHLRLYGASILLHLLNWCLLPVVMKLLVSKQLYPTNNRCWRGFGGKRNPLTL
jgi:hypothetical protein